jgi:beta-alanine degradation protein BauB
MAIMKTLISIVCFTVISWATAAAQDVVKVAPQNFKVLLNNAHVRVLDGRIKPGQKIPMHASPNRVLYAITPGTAKLTGSDGKTTTVRRKAGEVWWRDAESIAVENTGKAEIHTLVVELKK